MAQDNGSLSTLKPQPGQTDSYNPTFHPLPGAWAQEQLAKPPTFREPSAQASEGRSSGSWTGQTPIKQALASENAQHRYWEQWQGVTPGKAVYEDPRAFQNTLLPVARYGTDGR